MNADSPAKYRRYKVSVKIEGEAKKAALADYIRHYTEIAKTNPALLNQKLPKRVSETVLNEVGLLLQRYARELSTTEGPLKDFLGRNPVPACLGNELTDEIRAFCLVLHSLRQWATAEALATDRFLISGNVRKDLKELFTICPVAPDDADTSKVELHHPVRDGRPPIPLSKRGHDTVEGLLVLEEGDRAGSALVAFRRDYGPISWKRLRVGCMALLESSPEGFADSYLANARSWARKAKKITRLEETPILAFLDRYELGLLDE
ncbi:MAG TPA: hypothetical protein VG734_18025 [Lacunisphaera sp.]|nr:hypothetical protein [Lacunisphaera sp.]